MQETGLATAEETLADHPTISVAINVYNEAHLLRDCLESVASWADEIIVTDMGSSDGSAEIYREYADKVFLIAKEPIVEKARNLAITQATKEWILLLDPDERVAAALARQVKEYLGRNDFAAYRLPLKDYIFGKWIRYTGWQGNREIGLIRLFRREKVTWRPDVHSEPEVNGPVGSIIYDASLDNAVIHLNYVSVEQFIEKLNRYTSAEAEKRLSDGKTYHWLKLFYHPLTTFWRRYVVGKGYKDGMHGLILSILMAFYADLILIKMWEAQRESKPEDRAE